MVPLTKVAKVIIKTSQELTMSANGFPSLPDFNNLSFRYRKTLSVIDFVKKARFRTKKKKADDFWGVHLRRCRSMHLQRSHSIPVKVDHCLNPNVKLDHVSSDQFHSLDNVSMIKGDVPNCAINDAVLVVEDYQIVGNPGNEEISDDNEDDTNQNKKQNKSDKNIFDVKGVKQNSVQIPDTASLGSVIKRASQLINIDKKDFPSKIFHQIFSKKFSTRSVRDESDLSEKTEISSNTYHFCKK